MKTSITTPSLRSHLLPMLAILLIGSLAASVTVSARGVRCGGCNHGERLLPSTILQLESARQCAGRFHDIEVALAEGYIDVDFYMPGMGWHFLNPNLLDGEFVPTEPEILVYEVDCDGTYKLVALEYAIPLELSAKPPRGFIGKNDVWFEDLGFQLWTLHAWVFDYNPDGVFQKFNPRVP